MGVQLAVASLLALLLVLSLQLQNLELSSSVILSGATPIAVLVASLLAGLAALALHLHARGLRAVRSLVPPAPWRTHLKAGCIGIVLSVAAITMFDWHNSGLGAGIWPSSVPGMVSSSGVGQICYIITLLVVAPVFEELFFREALLVYFHRTLGMWRSALLSTVLFTAMHFVGSSRSWPAVIGITALGISACYMRERTATVAPCITLHLFYNAPIVLVVLHLAEASR
jgi:membrane protease YdiL (CAAX protease family)